MLDKKLKVLQLKSCKNNQDTSSRKIEEWVKNGGGSDFRDYILDSSFDAKELYRQKKTRNLTKKIVCKSVSIYAKQKTNIFSQRIQLKPPETKKKNVAGASLENTIKHLSSLNNSNSFLPPINLKNQSALKSLSNIQSLRSSQGSEES